MNTTSQNTAANYTSHPMKTYCLNSGKGGLLPDVELDFSSERIKSAREIIDKEATLINMPFGTVEFQSRRSASTLEFATAYKSEINLTSAVSSKGQNLELWNEFAAYNGVAIKFGKHRHILTHTLKAPATGPWHVTCIRLGCSLLTPWQFEEILALHIAIARVFVFDSTNTAKK